MSGGDAPRVCPICGLPVGRQATCGACGADLTRHAQLPTRAEWEASRRQAGTPAGGAPPARWGPPADGPPPSPPAAGAPPRPAGPPDFAPSAEPELRGRLMANWGYRAGGYLVDVAVAILIGLGAAGVARAAGASDDAAGGIGTFTAIGAWLLDTCVLFGITRGQTVGKLLAGTRVVRESGRPARFGTGLLRDTICRFLFVIPLVALIDAFLPLGPARQSIRDKLVGTRVLREPAYPSRQWILTAAAVALTAAWVGVAAFTTDWDTSDTYGAFDRDVFISGCTDEGGTRRGCGCAFDYIKARVPYDEYRHADRTPDPDDWSPRMRRVTADAFTKCPQ